MPATAKLSNYRQSPRKVRLVANLLKGKKVDEALVEVGLLGKRAATPIEKLIKSAVANAKALDMAVAELYVKELRVDKGVVTKRFMPRAMGRAFPIMKRSSTISVMLEVKGGREKNAKTAKATEGKKTTATKTVAKKTTKKTTK